MDGHLRHPPYAALHFISDFNWVCAFFVAMVLAYRATLPNRVWYLAYLPLLAVRRLLLRSMGGSLFLIEGPIALIMQVRSAADSWRI